MSVSDSHRLAIVGGGFSGALLAIKLAESSPAIRPALIESGPAFGAGLAYGACEPHHLLNVAVSRMELGLTPSFESWLGGHLDEISAPVAETYGYLSRAFVPRHLFGRYIREHLDLAVAGGRIETVRGQVAAVRKSDQGYLLHLSDGRTLAAPKLILATGNQPPKTPRVSEQAGPSLECSHLFASDPWKTGALDGLAPDRAVLILGTGLTMVDVALSLHAKGHKGKIFAVSRRGLLPLSHDLIGGVWPPFVSQSDAYTPLALLRCLREEACKAQQHDVPWARVIDAVRPQLADIWAGWTPLQRSQFLRHARPYWDIHRHRLAPHIAEEFATLLKGGQVVPMAGQLKSFSAEGDGLMVSIGLRHGHITRDLTVARVINCTGPRADLIHEANALFTDLQEQGLIRPDKLGLGLDTADTCVIDGHGRASDSLYALGALTRPALWEITAVPDIRLQIERLVRVLSQPDTLESLQNESFADLGTGI